MLEKIESLLKLTVGQQVFLYTGRVDGYFFSVDGDFYTAYVNNATSGTHTINHITPGQL